MADEAAPPAAEAAPPVKTRPTPSPIRVDLQESDSDIHSNSSPFGAALMQRKVERQAHPELQDSLLRPSQPLDSPGWESRMQQMKADADPTQNSSPLGTALLARKVERQKEQLDRPLPRSGDVMPGGGELQRPPPRSPAT